MAEKEDKPTKPVKSHLFGDKPLSIDNYEPNKKSIYRTLGLPENYDEVINPNAD